jgi:glycosyltransferase involved in cell wall biosynthesis
LKVSVVVPTYRRPQLLNRCLAALAGQQFDHGKFEIIIVDDGPSADTGHLVLSWATHTLEHGPVIRYLANTGSHGPAAARNVWPAACGDIIAFTDDDTIPAPGWRAYGVKAMRNGVVAAWGRLVMPIPDPPTDYELDAAGLERAEFVTANCFARKSAVEAIGGFDERFKLAWREEADLFFACSNTTPASSTPRMRWWCTRCVPHRRDLRPAAAQGAVRRTALQKAPRFVPPKDPPRTALEILRHRRRAHR